MQYVKRYIAFTLVLVIGFLLKFNTFAEDYQQISNFRGASMQKVDWNPMIAASVNENLLSIVIDNKEYTNEEYSFYMNDELNIMLPTNMLAEALNCSAHVYDGDTLVLEKHSSKLVFGVDESTVEVNGEYMPIISPLVNANNELYVSMNDISSYMNYSYNWNVEENIAQAADAYHDTSIFPAKYDLRERMRVSDIRNQGNNGTCWAFAALSAIESVLLPEEIFEFSIDHMTLQNDFNLTQQEGGEYTMGMAYLAAWQGPVLGETDPYGDGVTDEELETVKHVQEIQVIGAKDYEKIKEAVFKYGGVQTSIYSALRNAGSKSQYYNSDTKAYCYIGTEKPNHDVVIVGWDDNYSKDNFSVNLEGDGAFICQNSWGSSFGEQGFFYISYYDTNVGTHNVSYTRIDAVNNYDHIYQSDLCGWIGQLGYNKESIFGANVFTAVSDEVLKAISFYATGKDTEYELFVVQNFKDMKSLNERIPVASGKLSNAGYYTIDFKQEIMLNAGEKYAVILHIITPDAVHPLAIEYAADKATANVDTDDGEGYISTNGNDWENVKDIIDSNLCIKAFSRKR